jgi:leukotriene-A4 hydrolase
MEKQDNKQEEVINILNSLNINNDKSNSLSKSNYVDLDKESILKLISKKDSSSFANTEDIIQTNIKFGLFVGIDETSFWLEGKVDLNMKITNPDINHIVLDNSYLELNSLSISTTSTILSNSQEQLSKSEMIDQEEYYNYYIVNNKSFTDLGTPIIITLKEKFKKKIAENNITSITISISYKALQSKFWVYVKAKKNKRDYPVGYILNECIGARTCFPCQDTPSVKTTFEAVLRTNKPYTAYCSAILTSKSESEISHFNIFHYKQANPIPTYLIVFAIGCFETVKIHDRINVYCEKDYVKIAEEAYLSLNETIEITENILIDYLWGEFNILAVPDFVYHGMENPNLVYIDANQLMSEGLIVHELVHSWFGNLVTNSNWENFWINEGITTFFENKMSKILEDDDYYYTRLSSQNSFVKNMVESYSKLNDAYRRTSLHPDYQHENPLNIYGMFPYYKGALFMRYIENQIGEDNLLSLLRKMLNTFKFKSIDWVNLKMFFDENVKFLDKKIVENYELIDWNSWILDAGLPIWFDY